MLAVRHSRSQHYSTLFNPRTGFFARIEDRGYPEPLWSENGPEMMDIAITNWCDRECTVCYRCSDTQGGHMPLETYKSILKQAADIGVMQVALGGGNPNQHPDFCDILRSTREYGVVPSFTTNGRGLNADIVEASRKYCGAVAVSAYEPYCETWAAARKLVDEGVKTNLHFVLNAQSIGTAIEWMETPPRGVHGINAIVFLNYKPVGRTSAGGDLLHTSPRVAEFFRLACRREHQFRVGFDSCMVSGLATYTEVNPVWFDACEAARFSMFISEKSAAYPCSFMETVVAGERITNGNLRQIWQRSALFKQFRDTLLGPHCPACPNRRTCLGGCPAYPEANLCQIPA